MEMNGPANIKLLVEMIRRTSTDGLSNDTMRDLQSIDNQADCLMDYLKAIDDILTAHDLQSKVPYWHDIRVAREKTNGID